MYRVECWFCSAGKGGWGLFRRELELPFAPFVGLQLYFPEASDEGWVVRVVAWTVGETRFVCRVDGDEDCPWDWEKIKEYYALRGWYPEEGGRGPHPPTKPQSSSSGGSSRS